MQVLYNSLSDFTEIIAAGTAAALVPIHSITRRSTGDKFTFESGPLCQKLSTYLRKIQRGETDDFAHWIEVLQPPETVYKKYKSAELPSYTNGNTHHVEGTDK